MEDIFETQSELQEEQADTETTDNVVELTDELADNHLSEIGLSDDTENSKESEEKSAKNDKLNPYEKIILEEMWNRSGVNTEGAEIDQRLLDGLESKDKNIHACFQYIVAQAKKKASGNCAMIEDSVVYGWAHHYYIEPKEVIDAELHPKPKEKPKTDTKVENPKVTPKADTKVKKTKKATYNDNPLLKAVMGKKKTDSKQKGGEIAHKVKRNGKVFTITEFTLF